MSLEISPESRSYMRDTSAPGKLEKFIFTLLLCLSAVANAQNIYMVRSDASFPESMALLQETIAQHGYQVSKVQRVDIGLIKSGYKTDKYRVVFFGKPEEIKQIVNDYPELVPYIPLKIAIFAEQENTILVASGFRHLRLFYTDPVLQADFDRWEKDIRSILEKLRSTD